MELPAKDWPSVGAILHSGTIHSVVRAFRLITATIVSSNSSVVVAQSFILVLSLIWGILYYLTRSYSPWRVCLVVLKLALVSVL